MTGTVISVIVSILILLGSLVILIGAAGLIRFPDIYCRLHAATKGPTLGIISIMLASMIYFYYLGNGFSASNFLTIIFVMLTSPVGSHMIAKSAYHYSVKLWEGSHCDEWDVNDIMEDQEYFNHTH